MIGTTYKRKSDGHVLRVTGQTHEAPAAWVMQDETEFSSPVSVLASDLRRDFVKAGDAPEPVTTTDEQAGWDRLSAEGKLNAWALAAIEGELVEGDRLGGPAVSGAQIEAPVPLDSEAISRLKARARRLRGVGRRAPSPEDVFAKNDAQALQAAADKVWESSGVNGLLVRYELGQLEVAPPVAKELDRRLARRNREADR